MALKGQKRRFAEAIVSAKPLKISNKEAALLIGSSEKSASAAGSRWAADVEVKTYILAHWPDYYGTAAPVSAAPETAKQEEMPLFCANTVSEWLSTSADDEDRAQIARVLAQGNQETAAPVTLKAVLAHLQKLNPDDSEFLQIVKAVCDKLRVSLDPLDYWNSVLINPWASEKEKEKAAADKAKYTIAKPASVNKKDSALERAQILREQRRQANAVGDFFAADSASEVANSGDSVRQTGFNRNVPVWN